MMTPENTPIDGGVPQAADLSSLTLPETTTSVTTDPIPEPEATQVETPAVTEPATTEEAEFLNVDMEEKKLPPEPAVYSPATAAPIGLVKDDDDDDGSSTDDGAGNTTGEEPDALEPVQDISATTAGWGELKEVIIDGENIRDVHSTFTRISEGNPGDMELVVPGTIRHNMAVIGENLGEIENQNQLGHAIMLERSLMVSPKDNIDMGRLQRPGSDWTQEWTFPILNKKPGKIGINDTSYKPFKSGGQELVGDKAIDRFMFGTGMGMPKSTPLVNTGIWVRISPPGANFLATIDRNLAFARAQFGLDTNGLAGSVDDLIFREVLNEAALSLVTASNYPVNNPLDLREVVDKEDMRTLVWGMACALYTQGIKIAIPCIDVKCNHIDTLLAAPNRMFFIDRSKLNEKQRTYLNRGLSNAMSLDDINDYKAQFKVDNTSSKRIGKHMFVFGSPVIADYLNIGRSWLSSVNEAVDKSMESADSRRLSDAEAERRRLDMMNSITSVEAICRYAHYIKEIIVYNDDSGDDTVNYGTITDKDTIRRLLQRLATEQEMLDEVFSAIDNFLVSIGASIVGYPNIPCPACKHETAPEKMKSKLILPFDPDTGFFILAQRKISEAGGTPLTDLSTFGHENFMEGVREREQQELLRRQASSQISNLS